VALAIAGALATIIGLIVALSPASAMLDVEPAVAADFRFVVALLAVNLLVSIPGSALENVYQGVQRFDLLNLRSIVAKVLAGAAQLALVLSGHGIVALAAVAVLASCATLLADLAILRRLCPGLLETPVRFHRDIWRRIRHFVTWSGADDLLAEGTVNLDEILIAALLPLSLLTPYALCVTIAGALLIVIQPIVTTLFPMAASLHASREREQLQRLLMLGTKGLLAVALPVALFLGPCGAAVISWWVPGAASGVTPDLMMVIVADTLLSAYVATSSALLLALNRVRAVVALRVTEVALQVLLIMLLAPTMGLLGVALAVLLANAAVGLLLELPLTCRLLGLTLASFARGTLARVVPSAAPAAVLAWWVGDGVASPAGLALTAAAVGTTCLAGLWLFGTTASERSEIAAVGRSLQRGAAAA
jgi:O-antigen/teichoic acid export membrane protein